MKFRQLQKNKILIVSLLGIISLLLWGAYLVISNDAFLFANTGYLVWGLLITKVLGLAASAYLVLHELKVHSPLADKLCNFSPKTNCDTVLSSRASKIYGGVTWADAGIIYFTGTLLYLAGANESSLWILALISVLALPYPFFSIFYQAVKIKVWCPFCLIVQVVLISEFMLLLPTLFRMSVSLTELLYLIVTFLIPATIWFTIKGYSNLLLNYRNVNNWYLMFRRNPEIFRFLLQKNKQGENINSSNDLMFGNLDAPVTITAFLNLYCDPCVTTFRYLINLIKNYPEVKLRLVFSFLDDKAALEFTNTLYFIYNRKGQKQAIEFLDRWYTSIYQADKLSINLPSFTNEFLYKWRSSKVSEKELLNEFEIADTIIQENNYLFNEQNVKATPTIHINGYRYPQHYKYSDIEYFIEDLKNLKEEVDRV